MTMPLPTARYLDGTAYIVYGPGLGPEPSTPLAHHPHTHSHTHSHSHAYNEPEDQPAHFWAVFRPSTTTNILSNPLPAPLGKQQQPPTQDQNQNDNDVIFVIQGKPHSWGSYPPDMEQPHGCLPPHLYYHVAISEHTSPITNNRHEWVVPFLHRIGDGNDHAGGLTTNYTLLHDQEDAEDNGDFIHARIRQLQQYHRELLSSSSSEPTATTSATENSISTSLYACTEVLISERRTLDVIQEQFFSSTIANSSSSLKEFQHHLQNILNAADNTTHSPSVTLSLVQSELKLILPLH